MTNTISLIQATDTRGWAAFRGTSINTGVQASAPPKPSRQVVVPEKDFLLFRNVGLAPPEQGMFDTFDLDKKLAPFDIETRMKVKTALFNCRLLQGRSV
jgi:hypothetical protein